ncbi:PREDICTED: uncharacterized protein LOC108759546 [Trachymyrmex cornetzi]|nr:PREDICTED: uncharacterized protein LOC108759546 [Trachymyrmex cornetzi]
MYCPVGSDRWCKWRVAESNNTLHEFDHEPPFHEDVQQAIKPIFEDLSSRELLERYLGGETQNNHKSYNSTVWVFAPKHLHYGAKIIEIATYLAVGIFNEGFYAGLKIMTTIGIVIGRNAKIFCNTRDQYRLERSTRQSLEATKEARIKRRNDQMALNNFYENEEGLYSPGIAK